MRMKLRVDVLNWHIGSGHRLGRRRGRLILIRFTLFMKKPEVLQATRNLAGTYI
jgi:hypothetical protein